MNMTVGQLIGGAAGIVIILSVFIEITPIKVNPVSTFLAWLGRKMNKEMSVKIDTLDKKVNGLEDQMADMQNGEDEREAVNCRIRILQFGDEVRHGNLHSEEAFDQVLQDIDQYNQYCEKHPDFVNSKTILTKERIKSVYAKCVDGDDGIEFLK